MHSSSQGLYIYNFKTSSIFSGEAESLPICGNDCIYRREAEGNDGQLYCFPRRYIERQNQCDFKANAPEPCRLKYDYFYLNNLSPSTWIFCLERVDKVPGRLWER